MPIYEYKCLRCNEVFEINAKITNKIVDPLHFSDTCEGEESVRQVSRTSFKLKGSGWYQDGYSKSPKGDLQSTVRDLKSNLDNTKSSLKNKANKID